VSVRELSTVSSNAHNGGRAAEETLALELFPTLAEIRYAIANLKGWRNETRWTPLSLLLTARG